MKIVLFLFTWIRNHHIYVNYVLSALNWLSYWSSLDHLSINNHKIINIEIKSFWHPNYLLPDTWAHDVHGPNPLSPLSLRDVGARVGLCRPSTCPCRHISTARILRQILPIFSFLVLKKILKNQNNSRNLCKLKKFITSFLELLFELNFLHWIKNLILLK